MKEEQVKSINIQIFNSPAVLFLLMFGVIGSVLGAREYRKIAASPEGEKPSLSNNVNNQINASQATRDKINISVESGRPLAQAIMIIEERFGWAITYEDPRYINPHEISDVTQKVRRDLDKFAPGRAPKVLVPKGGILNFEYQPTLGSGAPLDPNQVVQQLLAAHLASGNAGTFAMESAQNVIHVMPTGVKNREGKLALQKSILDETITLPSKQRTGLETLEDLCREVSKASGQRVLVGTIPVGLFAAYEGRDEIRTLKARDALVMLFRKTAKDVKLTWQLFYDPGMKVYVLNIESIDHIAQMKQ